MHLKRAKTSSVHIYLSIADFYYDKEKKMSRSKTIQSLGYLDDLEKQYDDPIAHFQKRVERLKMEKKAGQAPINFTFYDSDRLCASDTSLRKNFGYAPLSQIYHELAIHIFLINRQRHSKEGYDANSIMKLLVYSRLLQPSSIERFFEKTNYSLDDIYRCLDLFYKHRENIQVWLNDKIRKTTAGMPVSSIIMM